MANNGVTFALGLAQKAGKLASGDYAVRSALKNGKAKLLLVAADAAENSKKDMYFMAEMSDTPVVECLTRDELGWAIGKAKRTAVVVLDNSFVNMINNRPDFHKSVTGSQLSSPTAPVFFPGYTVPFLSADSSCHIA